MNLMNMRFELPINNFLGSNIYSTIAHPGDLCIYHWLFVDHQSRQHSNNKVGYHCYLLNNTIVHRPSGDK